MSGDSHVTLVELVEQARAEAGFDAMLLTGFDGRLVAAARADDTSPEMVGALLDVATRFAANPEDRTRLGGEGESTFFDWEGRRVVCRWFTAGQDQGRYLLVILVPHGRAYKRVASQLVRQAQRALGAGHSGADS